MLKLINRIRGQVPNTQKSVDITVNGKNLIIVGGNGCGKTSFLNAIFKKLENNISNDGLLKIEGIKRHVDLQKKHQIQVKDDPIAVRNSLSTQEGLERELSEILDGIVVEYNNPTTYIELKNRKISSIRLFEANRRANISNVTSATGSRTDGQSIDIKSNLGVNLEQHLVNLKVRTALGAQEAKSDARVSEIEDWFKRFVDDVRFLFEDDSTELIFDVETLKYSIKREGNPPHTFQTLSSGYLAIFDIYADLLMRTEYFRVSPRELSGVVIIDEIDAHLHVSLQRKILPFLSNSFPLVQFVVSTHSPFVLSSVDDAVIYDLSTNQQTDDLSMYSFEAIVEGLLGVPPISRRLEDLIKDLAKLVEFEDMDIKNVESILRKIKPYEEVLDTESEMFFQIAINKVLAAKKKGD